MRYDHTSIRWTLWGLLSAGALVAQLVLGVSSSAASVTDGRRSLDAPTFAAPGGVIGAPPTAGNPASRECKERAPRASFDRADEVKGRSVHVVYLVAADFPDHGLDRRALQCSVVSWNQWFTDASEGLAWRIDTFTQGDTPAVDITFVRSASTGSELLTSTAVEDALASAGLDDPRKLYLSYVAADAGNLCGSGRYPLAELSDPANPFSGHGRFAQVYLFSDPGCRAEDFGVPGDPRWVEATAMQEMLHTERVTPLGAPHSCTGLEPVPTHVCTPGLGAIELVGTGLDPERVDVMFPFVSMPLSEKVLDRDHDDYFRHPFPLRDLTDSPYVTKSSR